MPLYEYECEACGDAFERIQKFSDPPLEVCPKCGKGPVQKAALVARDPVQGIRLLHHRLRQEVVARLGEQIETRPRSSRQKSDSRAVVDSDSSRRDSSSGLRAASSGTTAPETKPSDSKASDARRLDASYAARTAGDVETEAAQILAERLRQIRPAQREVDDRFEESQLVPRVVADAVDRQP